MEKCVNKSSLIEEIERRKNICKKLLEVVLDQENKNYYQGKAEAYKEVLDILNTLEVKEVGFDIGSPEGDKSAVKEVDLEKELDEWKKHGPHTSYPWCTIPDAIEITAEHFFELGLKAQK